MIKRDKYGYIITENILRAFIEKKLDKEDIEIIKANLLVDYELRERLELVEMMVEAENEGEELTDFEKETIDDAVNRVTKGKQEIISMDDIVRNFIIKFVSFDKKDKTYPYDVFPTKQLDEYEIDLSRKNKNSYTFYISSEKSLLNTKFIIFHNDKEIASKYIENDTKNTSIDCKGELKSPIIIKVIVKN